LARQVKGLRSALKLPLLLLPMVIIAELMLITFLFSWPVPTGLIGILIAVAVTEELFKAAPSYAALNRGIIAPRHALAFGALVGVGFWLAEKAFLLISLAGLQDVPAAVSVMGTAGVSPVGLAPLAVAGLLLAPLVLHVVTAAITGWGARHDRRIFGASFVIAVALHTLYNLTIVNVIGGGVGF